MQTFQKIFEPITIKNLTLPNRLVVSSMRTNLVNEDGTVDERFIRYHEEKIKGGWGLVITENCLISPESGVSKCLPGLYCEEQVANFKIFTDRIHAAGGKIAAQIYHAGRAGNSVATGKPLVAPSAIRDCTKAEIPKALTIAEIEELVEQFGQAALRAKRAGFDAVEIHGASGYLLSQFVSPYSNKRTDAYGGTTQGRTKFSVDVVKRIRELVGENYPVFYRLATNEYIEGGLAIEEAKVVAKMLEAAGVDVMHCTQGIFATNEYTTPPYAISKGSLIHNAAAIKQVLQIPVIGVGGHVNDPAMAETMLLSNQVDMVTMARASLADPYLPAKAQQGRTEDILQCIGCVQGCLGPRAKGIRCLVNPFTGRETEFPVKQTKEAKTILVVGGGISGCEFAVAAARLGHQVTLIEKSTDLGGQWRIACVPNGKAEFANLITWQKTQLKKLQVIIRLQTELTKEILQEEQPDVLAIAIGSSHFIPPVPGLKQYGITAHDVLLGNHDTGKRVVVIGGGLVGAETAEFLAMQGKDVTILEMMPEIAKEAAANPRKLLLRNLKKNQVAIYTAAKVLEVQSNQVLFEKDTEPHKLAQVDTIVLATGVQSETLNPAILEAYQGNVLYIGDAEGVKNGLYNLQDAVEKAYSIE